MYEYRARTLEVVDGDTIDVDVDLGFNMRRTIRLRLAGVDTHETFGVPHDSPEHRRGAREAEFVREWLPAIDADDAGDWPIVVETDKRGKYGRYLARVTRQSDGADLAADLRETFDGVGA